MRKIKFRVWNANHKRFEKSVCVLPDGRLLYTETDYYQDFQNTDEKDFIIQEFIGIKDINGKEIYHGDFVSIILGPDIPDMTESRGVYEVVWDRIKCGFMLRVHKRNWFDTEIITDTETEKQTIDVNCPSIKVLTRDMPCNMEVIGNVFQNLELINEKN